MLFPGSARTALLASALVMQGIRMAMASSNLFCNPVPICIGAMKMCAAA